MNITTIVITVKKVWSVVDPVFRVCSLFAVPAIVTAPLIWVLQTDNGGPRFKARADSAVAAFSRSVSGELVFDEKPMKVFYRLELQDAEGHPVMKYPEKVTKGNPSFDNIMLSVPESLRPGEYRLVARVRYALNPIKGGTSTVQVASISVD